MMQFISVTSYVHFNNSAYEVVNSALHCMLISTTTSHLVYFCCWSWQGFNVILQTTSYWFFVALQGQRTHKYRHTLTHTNFICISQCLHPLPPPPGRGLTFKSNQNILCVSKRYSSVLYLTGERDEIQARPHLLHYSTIIIYCHHINCCPINICFPICLSSAMPGG